MSARLLKLEQVAEELGYSVSTVRRRIREGALPAFVDGQRGQIVRVRDVDLQRYIAERIVVGAPAPPAAGRAGRPVAAGGKLWD